MNCDIMEFPNTFDEFVKEYGFKDTEEVYTNGSELIQVFRANQWLEHIQKPTQMTVEQYRANLIDTFHRAGCDEFIVLVCLPEAVEFKRLENLLKEHYHRET